MEDLRCFCRGEPILAKWGQDGAGRPFVHVKVHKQGRIMGEVILDQGQMRIRCRNCLRWFTIRIREHVTLREEALPEQISVG